MTDLRELFMEEIPKNAKKKMMKKRVRGFVKHCTCRVFFLTVSSLKLQEKVEKLQKQTFAVHINFLQMKEKHVLSSETQCKHKKETVSFYYL